LSLLRAALRSSTTLIGASLVLIYGLLALLGPQVAPYSPIAQDLSQQLRPPSTAHWFGTDALGRDILSRTVHGLRVSMIAAGLVVALSVAVGTLLGTVAGYFGGVWDEGMMRLTDFFLAFPGLVLAMAIAAILHPSLINALLAISVTWWPTYARLLRGQILFVRRLEYVEAARATGGTASRIVVRHVLPNVMNLVLVKASLDVGGVILAAAGLSFIGFGAQPPTPELGLMVSEGRDYMVTQWWIPSIPAMAILVLVVGFNLLGDGLRDVFDPYTREL